MRTSAGQVGVALDGQHQEVSMHHTCSRRSPSHVLSPVAFTHLEANSLACRTISESPTACGRVEGACCCLSCHAAVLPWPPLPVPPLPICVDCTAADVDRAAAVAC
jgi:hypothetical protein